MSDFICVGLDVHARSIQGCAKNFETGEVWEKKMPNQPDVVLLWCLSLPGPCYVVYEAGPTGYELVRVLREHGVAADVLAPSKVLTAAGDRVKTDRRDAQRLAMVAGSPDPPVIWIPDCETEAARDVYRCREDAMLTKKSSMLRLDHFLLRHQRQWDHSTWTKAHVEWLMSQRFEQDCLQTTYDAYLGMVLDQRREVDALDKLIVTQYACLPRWEPVVTALECLRGISTLTAFGLAVEIGDWSRLSPVTIGSYVGLVPSESSSGESRSQAGITKTGNSHVRRLLVEAAWEHLKPYRPTQSPTLQRAWGKVSPVIKTRADHANRRLHDKWMHLEQRHKNRGKAVVAVARELSGFCRDLAIMAT